MKNKITVILVAGIAIILIGLFWGNGAKNQAALPVQSQVALGSTLFALEKEYDFGTISMKDGKVQTSFVVSNKSENDIRIDTVATSCMCTNAYIVNGEVRRGPFGMPGHGGVVPKANEIVKAGEEREIEVVFDPAAHGPAGVGVVERSIYLVDENGGALELKINAEVII